MIRLYINLHSYENQPNDELHQNLKDFDTIGDCFERFFLPKLIFYPLIPHTYHYFQTPLRTVINCHTLANPLPPPKVMT